MNSLWIAWGKVVAKGCIKVGQMRQWLKAHPYRKIYLAHWLLNPWTGGSGNTQCTQDAGGSSIPPWIEFCTRSPYQLGTISWLTNPLCNITGLPYMAFCMNNLQYLIISSVYMRRVYVSAPVKTPHCSFWLSKDAASATCVVKQNRT